jgi:hypothetical protein
MFEKAGAWQDLVRSRYGKEIKHLSSPEQKIQGPITVPNLAWSRRICVRNPREKGGHHQHPKACSAGVSEDESVLKQIDVNVTA